MILDCSKLLASVVGSGTTRKPTWLWWVTIHPNQVGSLVVPWPVLSSLSVCLDMLKEPDSAALLGLDNDTVQGVLDKPVHIEKSGAFGPAVFWQLPRNYLRAARIEASGSQNLPVQNCITG